MKNKVTFLSAAILFMACAAYAQNPDTIKTKGWFNHDICDFAGAAQIQVTYRKGSTQQLNQDLNSVGLPTLKTNDVWFNLSMNHYIHHWVMEDGIGFTPVSTSVVNNLRAHYNQYQAYLRMGYDLSPSPDYRLYPFIGVNLSAALLNIQDDNRQQDVTSFSNELLNSTSSKTLYQPNFGVEFGAGFDYLVKVKSRKMECYDIQRSIPIGVRAGYYLNTYASDWKINNYALNNGPTEKQSAVFVTFNIGLGYEVKK